MKVGQPSPSDAAPGYTCRWPRHSLARISGQTSPAAARSHAAALSPSVALWRASMPSVRTNWCKSQQVYGRHLSRIVPYMSAIHLHVRQQGIAQRESPSSCCPSLPPSVPMVGLLELVQLHGVPLQAPAARAWGASLKASLAGAGSLLSRICRSGLWQRGVRGLTRLAPSAVDRWCSAGRLRAGRVGSHAGRIRGGATPLQTYHRQIPTH